MDAAESVRIFIQAWNIDTDDKRLELLRACCDPQGVFAALMASSSAPFRRAYPAAEVVLGEPDTHNGYARFRWHTNWKDGREPCSVDDFVEVSRDGLIVKVVSFDGSSSPP